MSKYCHDVTASAHLFLLTCVTINQSSFPEESAFSDNMNVG